MRLKEAIGLLALPDSKLRCQAPFRESDSFAAFMKLGSDGAPYVHDVGISTTYVLAPGELAELHFADAEVDIPASEGSTSTTADQPLGFKPLRALTPRELRQQAPIQWLVKGVLPRRGIGMLYGGSGIGKSFVVLDIALAVTRGERWHERDVEKGGVLYVAAEGASGFAGRISAYEKHHGCDLSDVPFLLVPEAIDLSREDDIPRVIHAARSNTVAVSLIVVDTLNRVMPGADENAAEDVGRVIAAAQSIAMALDALVLVVHHAGKDQTRGARGHSSLRAAMDVELELRKEGDIRVVEVTKQRDGADGIRIAFKLQDVEVSYDLDTCEPVFVPVVVPTSAGQPVRRLSPWQQVAVTAHEIATIEEFEGDGKTLPFDALFRATPEAYARITAKETLPDRWREKLRRAVRQATHLFAVNSDTVEKI